MFFFFSPALHVSQAKLSVTGSFEMEIGFEFENPGQESR